MKYTIKEINTEYVKVEYEDGSNAQVPIRKGQSNYDIRFNIKAFSTTTHTPYDNTSDVPIAINFQGDTEDDLTVKNEYTYKDIRAAKYPQFGEQMDAAFKSRKGDNTMQNVIDAEIQAVKDKYPKDDTKYSDSDFF